MNAKTVNTKNVLVHLKKPVSFDTLVNVCAQGEHHILAHQAVHFDLSGIKHYDSSILVVLISWMRYAIQHKKLVQFINVPCTLRKMAQMCNLNKILKTEE